MLRPVLMAPTAAMIEFTHQETAYTVDRFGTSRRGLMVFHADTGQAMCVIVGDRNDHTVVPAPACRQEKADRLAAQAWAAWDALPESA